MQCHVHRCIPSAPKSSPEINQGPASLIETPEPDNPRATSQRPQYCAGKISFRRKRRQRLGMRSAAPFSGSKEGLRKGNSCLCAAVASTRPSHEPELSGYL